MTNPYTLFGNYGLDELVIALREAQEPELNVYDLDIPEGWRDLGFTEAEWVTAQQHKAEEVPELLAPEFERFGAAAVMPLVEILRDESVSAFVKRYAAWALWRIPDERAVEPLLSLLNASDARLKRSVIRTLGRIGDNRALEPIRHILLTDPDDALREEAASALAEIRHERAADALITAMKADASAEVRRLAAFALRNQSGEGVVLALIEALRDEAEIVPIWARYALDKKAEEAKPYLKRIHDENPEIIFRAFNTKPWEWVNASRENKYPESRAELDEMLGSVGRSIGEASAAKVTYRDRAHDCPVCGKPADQLAWFFFSTPPETWRALMGRAGWMTVCDDCHIQVDFFGGIVS